MSDKRLFDYLHQQLRECPQAKAFGSKIGNEWCYYSTQEVVDLVNRASVGLLRLGLRPGDKVASAVYKTTPDWNLAPALAPESFITHTAYDALSRPTKSVAPAAGRRFVQSVSL